jgi:hypothetical protein
VAQPQATEQPIHTGMLDTPGVFAEFETNLRRERQFEGSQRPKVPTAFDPGFSGEGVEGAEALRPVDNRKRPSSSGEHRFGC